VIFKAAAPPSGESSKTFIAVVATQTSIPAAAARAMPSTARFENLRSIRSPAAGKNSDGRIWFLENLSPGRAVDRPTIRQEFVGLWPRKDDFIRKGGGALEAGATLVCPVRAAGL